MRKEYKNEERNNDEEFRFYYTFFSGRGKEETKRADKRNIQVGSLLCRNTPLDRFYVQ